MAPETLLNALYDSDAEQVLYDNVFFFFIKMSYLNIFNRPLKEINNFNYEKTTTAGRNTFRKLACVYVSGSCAISPCQHKDISVLPATPAVPAPWP